MSCLSGRLYDEWIPKNYYSVQALLRACRRFCQFSNQPKVGKPLIIYWVFYLLSYSVAWTVTKGAAALRNGTSIIMQSALFHLWSRRGAKVALLGGGRKIFGWAQINFTLIFWREDQKKVFIRAVYFFPGTSLARGGTFTAWRGAAKSISAHFGTCPQIQGWKQKTGLGRKILGLVLAFTHVFCPGTKPHSRLGGYKQYFGEHRPKNVLQCHRASYFLSGHNPRLGGTLLAWGGTSSDLGGTAPKCPPLWRRVRFEAFY